MLKRMMLLSALVCLTPLFLTAESKAPIHPLDPITADEMAFTLSILKSAGKLDSGTRFPVIALQEPAKDEVLHFIPGSEFPREVFAMAFDSATGKVHEAIVDLRKNSLVSWKEIPGVQAPQMFEEYEAAQPVVRADSRWQDAMRKRGITDFEKVEVEAWAPGYPGNEWNGKRIFRCLSYYKGSGKNTESRPIEGVTAFLDVIQQKVIKVTDTGVVPVVKEAGEYAGPSVGPLREILKPLEIRQPDGPNFEIEGNEVKWQNWDFRFAMHPREGLVLYTVGYQDHGKLRSILYRASLSEMIVPYGDPDSDWSFRNPFDEGEYGLGHFVNSLVPRSDAPENATFFAAILNDAKGEAVEIPRAIAIYEKDGGLLWRHWDYDTTESRRARDLVVSWIATIGNYDYAFNWIFHQDGTLESEILLTGTMLVKGVDTASAGEHNAHESGHLVAPNILAIHHQHFFCFRLDLDVDGAAGNNIVELNTSPVAAGPGNPRHNAFIMSETPFHTEMEAQRNLNLASSRKWKVINTAVKNTMDDPVGYLLMPNENAVPYAAPDSWIRKRAGFLSHHLWVTKYDRNEQYAAGDYVNQSKGGDGLVKWTAKNRSLDQQDLVLWYNLGVTHIPRPEEWPVMTVHRTGFKLLPSSFFSRNPALDLPPANAAH